jgi:hypothetical protein
MATLYDRPAQVQPTEIPDAFGELPSEEYTAKAMPKVAGPLGLTATYVLIIFFITNTPSAIQAGAGTFTFWIVGGLTFLFPVLSVPPNLAICSLTKALSTIGRTGHSEDTGASSSPSAPGSHAYS